MLTGPTPSTYPPTDRHLCWLCVLSVSLIISITGQVPPDTLGAERRTCLSDLPGYGSCPFFMTSAGHKDKYRTQGLKHRTTSELRLFNSKITYHFTRISHQGKSGFAPTVKTGEVLEAFQFLTPLPPFLTMVAGCWLCVICL